MKITHVSGKAISLIKEFEGFSAKPYKCPAGIWTIGIGSTFYPDGRRVAYNDKTISESQAIDMLMYVLRTFEQHVDSFTTDAITQHQFDALVSFAYNLGPSNLKGSTLLKKVNANPDDPTIAAEFQKWNKSNGKVLAGLTRRRAAEAALYFS